MPIPEEFVKKRTEVTVSRATLQEIDCKGCGAKISAKNIQGGYARCEYCGAAYGLAVDGTTGQ